MQIPYRLAFYHTVQTIDNNEGEDAAVIWMCIIDQIVEAVIDPLHTYCEGDQGHNRTRLHISLRCFCCNG